MIYVEYFDSGRIHTIYSSTKPKTITPAIGSSVLQVVRDIDLDADYIDVSGDVDELTEKGSAFICI